MKKTLMVVALSSVVLSAFAGQETILAVIGEEVAYTNKAERGADGVPKETKAHLFVGERLVQDEHGLCWKDTVRLVSMKPFDANGMKIQLPTVENRRDIAHCPS